MTAQRRLGIVTLVIMLGLAGWSWHLLQQQRGAGRTPAPTSTDSNVPKALAVHTQARGPIPADPTNRFADDARAVALGERLFFDASFSASGTVSCATCHDPDRAFTDGQRVARGEGMGTRNTPTILGAARRRWFTWDGRADTIWSQAAEPIEQASEHGFDRTRFAVAIRDDPAVRRLWEAACGSFPAVLDAVPKALAARPALAGEDEGDAVVQAAKGVGNGRVAAFVSAPGSAGTLAAGDHMKSLWPDSKIVALEPRQCSTLYNGGQGQHRIEGIGDKMVTLIHNVFNTDLLMLIHDEDTVRGMEVIQSGTHVLVDRLGVPSADGCNLFGKFGPSCICNIIGAIKTAKYLGLGPEDNVVTIATDSYDRYPSVSQALYERNGGKPDDEQLELWAKSVFLGASLGEVVDLTQAGQQQRLHQMKADLWTRFGYSDAYIRKMADQAFWDAEYAKIKEIDPLIEETRGKIG